MNLKILILTIIISCVFLQSYADEMIIHFNNGKMIKYDTDSIKKITYSKSNDDVVVILDSRIDEYKSIGNGFGLLGDFELTGEIKILETYRGDGASWAGLLIRTDQENGKHGKNTGYLCFIRENGEVGIHSSIVNHIRSQKKTSNKGKNTNHITIRAKSENIKIYVNDVLVLDEDHARIPRGYISLNVGGAKAKFTIKSIKKI